MRRPHRLAWIVSDQCMPAHTKRETGVGIPTLPPRLDAHAFSRSSRDPLLGPDLVDVVARREGARTRRLPPERGGHTLREVTDNRPVFLESQLVGDRQEEGVGVREGAILAQLLDERRGQCVRP